MRNDLTDTEYDFVHKGIPIKEVPHCFLVPRGWTALLDAVGRAILGRGEKGVKFLREVMCSAKSIC